MSTQDLVKFGRELNDGQLVCDNIIRFLHKEEHIAQSMSLPAEEGNPVRERYQRCLNLIYTAREYLNHIRQEYALEIGLAEEHEA